MRRLLPVALLLALAAILALAWQQHWFGLGSTEPVGPEVTPETGPGEEAGLGGLAGRGTKAMPAEDPAVWEGDPVGLLTLDLGKAVVTGRVTGDGRPLRFARVSPVLAPPDEARSVRTTKEGTFEIRGLPSGEADLRVAAQGWWSRTVRTAALVDGVTTDVGEVALKARPAPNDGIEVKVLDPAGRPVANAKVAATTMTFGLYVTMGAAMAGIPDVITREGVTDDLGVARFQPIPAEKYDVVVRAPGFMLEAVENVVVAAGRVEHVAVTLRPGLSIQGTVVDVEGSPVAGAYVTGLTQSTFRQAAAVQTDASGSFTLDGLQAGSYWLFAGHDEKGDGQATQVKAGDRGVRIDLKGAARLTGRVLTTAGTPCPKFVLRPYPAQPFRYVYSRLYEFADPEGRFSLSIPPGTYQIDAKADGASFTSVANVTVEAGTPKEIEIRLPAEGVVTGVVTDPDGNHLAGAEVYVKRGGFPPTPVREQYVRSDADGHFALRNLPLEKQNLHVRHASFAAKVVEAMPTTAAQAKEVTVRLTAGARVAGRVTTKDGRPVAGARLNLFQGFAFFDARSAFTAADGAYEFRAVAAGDYVVSLGRFEANASGPTQRVKVPEDGTATADFVTEGDTTASGTVQGRVTVGGAPAANATVTAIDERGFGDAVSVKTDAEGRYVATGLRPGRITVSVGTATGLQDSDATRLADATQPATLDFAFGTAAVKATLVGSDGRTTVSGAWVQVESAAAKPGQEGWQTIKAVIQSDNAGLLVAQGLEPGPYRLRISGVGYAARLTDAFTVGEGESRDLGTIRLESGGGIAGRVTDETGTPLEGIGVSAKNAKGEDVFLFNLVSTGSNGRYEIQALEFGRYTVKFEGKGYAPVEKMADVSAQGAVVDAVLARGGSVTVRVEDEGGQPVEGARVVLFDGSGAEVKRTLSIVTAFDEVSRTSAQGQARIRDLAPGGYRATARKDGWTAAGDPSPFNVGAGGEVSVVVVLKPAK